MSIKLFNGLLDIGGILTETYYRKTRASAEAKEALGLDPNSTPNASIGIASVNEYVTFSTTNLGAEDSIYFDLNPFEQVLELNAIFIDNGSEDSFVLEFMRWYNLPTGGGEWRNFLKQTFLRSKTPAFFSSMPLPIDTVIKLTAKTDIEAVRMVLKPCMMIGARYGDRVPPNMEDEQGQSQSETTF